MDDIAEFTELGKRRPAIADLLERHAGRPPSRSQRSARRRSCSSTRRWQSATRSSGPRVFRVQMQAEAGTIVMVTHNLDEVRNLHRAVGSTRASCG